MRFCLYGSGPLGPKPYPAVGTTLSETTLLDTEAAPAQPSEEPAQAPPPASEGNEPGGRATGAVALPGVLRTATAAGATAGFLLAMAGSVLATRSNLLASNGEAVLLTAYVLVPYLLGGALAGLALGFAAWGVARAWGRIPSAALAGLLWGTTLGVASAGALLHTERVMRSGVAQDTARSGLAGPLGVVLLLLMLSAGIGAFVGRMRARRNPVAIPLIAVGVACWAASLVGGHPVPPAPPAQAPGMGEVTFSSWPLPELGAKRVLLVGVDGMSWKELTDAIPTGAVPNLARLRDMGASGGLHSSSGSDPAQVWASVLTGKGWRKHGIRGASALAFPGLREGVAFPDLALGLEGVGRLYRLAGVAGRGGDIADRLRTGLLWDMIGAAGGTVSIIRDEKEAAENIRSFPTDLCFVKLDPVARKDLASSVAHVDRVLGECIEAERAVGSEPDFVVFVSDGATVDADEPGVLLLAGSGIIPGTRLRSADVEDVTPTLLACLELPVGRDMDGRVLREAIDPTLIATPDPEVVPSYDPILKSRRPLPEASLALGPALPDR